MKPERKLAETRSPEGSAVTLYEHDGAYSLRVGHDELMNSLATASEIVLGEQASWRGSPEHPHVLIGGLGLGYTLRAALRVVDAEAQVTVVELLPELVQCNRILLRGLNGTALVDARVQVIVGDAVQVLARSAPASYDAILLDVDNGPTAMVQAGNAAIYRAPGLGQIVQALRPGGRVAFWSASVVPSFERQLRRTGLSVQVLHARRYAHARTASCRVYVGEKLRPRR